MRQRYLVSLGVLAVATLSIAVQNTAPKPASTQAAPAAAAPKPATPAGKPAATVPRTPWGDPDLQGTWFVLADVPLQRSAANAGKEFLTDEEVAAADKRKGLDPGRNARSSGAKDVSGAYNAVFNSVLRTGKRTSMVIDPPDGKIPPLVSGAPAQGRGGFAGQGGRGGGNDN